MLFLIHKDGNDELSGEELKADKCENTYLERGRTKPTL